MQTSIIPFQAFLSTTRIQLLCCMLMSLRRQASAFLGATRGATHEAYEASSLTKLNLNSHTCHVDHSQTQKSERFLLHRHFQRELRNF